LRRLSPGDATQVAEHATRSDSKLTDEAIAPSTTAAQIVVTKQTVEELSSDHVMIVGPSAAKDSPVEANDTTEDILDREAIE
jgi:hypothetical protein